MNYCKVIIAGRIAKDLELKNTTSGNAVINFPVAVARISKDKNSSTDFFEVVAWNKTAEFISKYFKKGAGILVEGVLQTRAFTGSKGNNRKVVEIIADKVEFADNKATTEPTEPTTDGNSYEDDDNLPF